MFREIIFIVSGTRLLETSTSIVERKILFNKFKKKKNPRKNPFPTTLGITFLDLNLSQTIIEARFIYIYIYPMQKNQVILINHPTQPATFSPFPNQRYTQKPRSPIPQPASTCLDPQQTTNQKIPKYHNLLRVRLFLSSIPTYLNISPFKKETFLDPSR